LTSAGFAKSCRKEDFALSRPYEGDMSVRDVWAQLEGNRDAFLIDVRTRAEWAFVGVPLVPAGAREPLFAEWQSYPTMAMDPSFADAVEAAILGAGGSKESSRLFFLCRSGARSQGSAAALTAAGFAHCFNIESGFEGPPDADGHRGQVAGWKADGLPWAQK
jgi:rhodanese-related sulfurtransferase